MGDAPTDRMLWQLSLILAEIANSVGTEENGEHKEFETENERKSNEP
jgi:hypothetical protein